MPELSRYIDVSADPAVAATRIALGAIAGFILQTEVSGVAAAMAVGASAPTLLLHLRGAARQVTEEQQRQVGDE